MMTRVRFGRRVSTSFETICVVGDADLDEIFLVRGVEVRRGEETVAFGVEGEEAAALVVDSKIEARPRFRFREGDGDGVCAGKVTASGLEACFAGELFE
jgi:hypothetical protein